MEHELKRLAAVLHQIAHDAGCALLKPGAPDAARFCTTQYNRVHARIAEIDPDLTALFGTLPDEATAGQVRIVARAMAASIKEKTRTARKNAWAECLGFHWPGVSLKFDFCC